LRHSVVQLLFIYTHWHPNEENTFRFISFRFIYSSRCGFQNKTPLRLF